MELKPHHIENLVFHHLTNFRFLKKSLVSDAYKSMISSPDAEVRVVRRKDRICHLADPSCDNNGGNCDNDGLRDLMAIESYKLEYGACYTIGQLLDKGQRFYEDTGWYTPLNRIHRMNNLD